MLYLGNPPENKYVYIYYIDTITHIPRVLHVAVPAGKPIIKVKLISSYFSRNTFKHIWNLSCDSYWNIDQKSADLK